MNVNQMFTSLRYLDEATDRSQKLLQKALFCPAIQQLYERAKSTPYPGTGKIGDWTVKFVSNLKFKAQCDHVKREIYLRTSLSENQALSALVFELTNAVSSSKFYQIDFNAWNRKINSEQYTEEIERIEYEGTRLHHEIMQHAISKMGWDKSLDQYAYWHEKGWNFERYWQIQRFNPHAQHYRDQFKKYYGKQVPLGFREKLFSAKYLMMHFSFCDFTKVLVIGLINGLVVGMFSGYKLGVIAGVVGFTGAIAHRCISIYHFR